MIFFVDFKAIFFRLLKSTLLIHITHLSISLSLLILSITDKRENEGQGQGVEERDLRHSTEMSESGGRASECEGVDNRLPRAGGTAKFSK